MIEETLIIAQFAFATLLPVLACLVLSRLRKTAAIARLSETRWQIVVGIVFGIIAIYGTEAGIPVNGATMNVRDAAPLAAGLFFGGPAGIIAGFIGGVERWFAVYWGAGEFTQLACALGTIFAGIYAALLRRYLFDDRICTWPMALATGIVAEVLHLLLVFVTNFDDSVRAFAVVKACSIPMIGCVALSAALCAIAIALYNKQPVILPRDSRGVAQIVQSRLLIGVFAAFLITIGFTALLQTSLSASDTETLLQLSIDDAEKNIVDASDKNLLELTNRASSTIASAEGATNEECERLAEELDVAEINVVDENGIIVATNNEDFIGFDMASGEQSAEFLSLLPDGDKRELVQSYQPISYDGNVSRKYAGVSIDDGFIQVGYDSKNFVDDLSAQVETAIKSRHVGVGGELIVIEDTGRVIATRNDSTTGTGRLEADSSAAQPGEVFKTSYGGVDYYAKYENAESYRLIALLPVEEANFSRDVSVLIMAFMEVVVFAALFLIIYFAIKRVVVRSIWKVNGQLGEITRGNLNTEVNVRESVEFSSLSDDINRTVGALKDSIATVQADLEMAADIQANTLPALTPDITGNQSFELFASMEPAKEVGGDFFDFFMLDADHIALVVADVSGKGVPAALFMMQSKTVLKMETYAAGGDPATALLNTNADLSEKNENDMFTTAWLGVLEISTGRLTFADAGHEKLAIYRNGVWELPRKPNGSVALASFTQEDYAMLPERYRYRNHTITLEPGDAIFQYTDGVTEATDAEDELFGEERLLLALGSAEDSHPEQLLPHVREEIAVFVKDVPQFDDITMLGLLYKGNNDTNGTKTTKQSETE